MEIKQIEIREDYVIQAFETINNPTSPSANVQLANNYLSSCEQSTVNFTILLLKLFMSSSNQAIQLQSLLLFGNIIKRNWSNKRGKLRQGFQTLKGQLKVGILQAYKQKGQKYIKHMNQILSYISKLEYPSGYPELHSFMLEGLQNINNIIQSKGPTQILGSYKSIVNLLSTIKCVLKQYSQKRISQDKETFLQKIVVIIQSLLQIDKLLQFFFQSSQTKQNDLEIVAQLARKVDKIVLYGLLSITTALQTNNDIQALFYQFIKKVELYDNLWRSGKISRSTIQLNLLAIIQLGSLIQEKYPLLLCQFLGQYLLIAKHCFQSAKKRQNQRLIATSIRSLCLIFQAYPYFKTPAEFAQINRRDTHQVEAVMQKKCHETFIDFFKEQNLNSIFNETILLMEQYPQRKQENQLLFEDMNNVIIEGDRTLYQQCLKMIQQFLYCHKNYGQKLISNLIKMSQENTKNIILIDIISVVPKACQQQEIPIQNIMKLLQTLYESKSYELFAKLIKAYQQYLKHQQAKQCLAILIKIVDQQDVVQPQTLYQIFLTIKKIMVAYDGQNMIQGYDLSKLFMKLLLLHRIYITNPILIWPLVNLTTEILKCLSSHTIELLLPNVISCLQPLLASNDELVINPLSQLFLMLLQKPLKVQSKYLHKMLALIAKNIQNPKLQSTLNIFKLWIELIRQFPTSKQQQISNQIIFDFKMCFEKYGHFVQQDSPQLYLQLVQDYMMAGLLQMDISKINQLFTKVMENQTEQAAHNCRVSRGMFSLYYSYCIGLNTCFEQWLIKIMDQLKYFHNLISPKYNSLRSLLLQIFHYHILKLSPQVVFRKLNTQYKDYKVWFQAYYWSLEYVNNKYSRKMNALGILQSLNLMESLGMLTNQIQNNYPFDTIFKILVEELKPLQQQTGISGLLQIYQMKQSSIHLDRVPKKILHQFSKQVCFKDLRPVFGQQISQILKKWNWGIDDLQQRFSESTIKKIMECIQGKYQQGQLQIGDLR